MERRMPLEELVDSKVALAAYRMAGEIGRVYEPELIERCSQLELEPGLTLSPRDVFASVRRLQINRYLTPAEEEEWYVVNKKEIDLHWGLLKRNNLKRLS
ncbi:MAG: hypothetical protein HYW26_04735 [Candidatus Aenigmarchaeota archaeon]|nr:hypothetical protein [Candidatus Aenigmarchaeota archaeon]